MPDEIEMPDGSIMDVRGASEAQIRTAVKNYLAKNPQKKPAAEPMAASHEPQKPMAASHEKAPLMARKPEAMKVPEIDPGTGRQKTAGRTMNDAETGQYRTAAMALAAGTAGASLGASAVAGMGTTAVAQFGIQAAARVIGAAIGGAGGEAYGQLIEHASGAGPMTSGVATKRIAVSASDQAVMESVGVGVEGVAKAVALGAKGGATWVMDKLRGTKVYQEILGRYAAGITKSNEAAILMANDSSAKIADAFLPAPAAGELSIVAEGIVKKSEREVAKNVQAGFEGVKATFTEAKSKIDYVDVADVVIETENAVPRAKGGLRVMTEPESEWSKFVSAMRKGNKVPTEKETVSAIVDSSGTPFQKTPAIKGKAPNADEDAAAVVDALGTISQRLHQLKMTPHAPREYIAGLQQAHDMLVGKLNATLAEISPEAPGALNAVRKYYGRTSEIQKQALYKLMKDGDKDVAKALMDPTAPEGIRILKSVAAEVKDETLVPMAQRAVVDRLLNPKQLSSPTGAAVVDMVNFTHNLKKMGATGEALFTDPAAAKMISGLKEQAKVFERLQEVPRATGETVNGIVNRLLSHSIGAAVGGHIGYQQTHTWTGAGLGAAVGGLVDHKVYEVLLRIAENPKANANFLKALSMVEKGGEMSGEAIALAGRASRMVEKQKYIGEPKKKEPPK